MYQVNSICSVCHQPMTSGSTITKDRKTGATIHMGTELWSHKLGMPNPGVGMSHMGCPYGDEQIIMNLRIAMDQGFKPEFCRTHELRHKEQERRN